MALNRSEEPNGAANGATGIANGGRGVHIDRESVASPPPAAAKHHGNADVEVKQGDYEKLYGGFGKEMRIMFEFWRDMGECSWRVTGHSDDNGDDSDGGIIVSLEGLLGARGQRVVDLEQSFRELTLPYPCLRTG